MTPSRQAINGCSNKYCSKLQPRTQHTDRRTSTTASCETPSQAPKVPRLDKFLREGSHSLVQLDFRKSKFDGQFGDISKEVLNRAAIVPKTKKLMIKAETRDGIVIDIPVSNFIAAVTVHDVLKEIYKKMGNQLIIEKSKTPERGIEKRCKSAPVNERGYHRTNSGKIINHFEKHFFDGLRIDERDSRVCWLHLRSSRERR